jgi:hypothetical protein
MERGFLTWWHTVKRDWKEFLGRFGMTREEKRMLALVLLVALVGLFARYWHLSHRKPEPFVPPGAPEAGGNPPHAHVEE